MSAFRLEADTPPYPNDVGFGPEADIRPTRAATTREARPG